MQSQPFNLEETEQDLRDPTVDFTFYDDAIERPMINPPTKKQTSLYHFRVLPDTSEHKMKRGQV